MKEEITIKINHHEEETTFSGDVIPERYIIRTLLNGEIHKTARMKTTEPDLVSFKNMALSEHLRYLLTILKP